MSSEEDFIKSYKLAGLVLGKKNSLTSGQIPVVSTGVDGQIEDSGITKDQLSSITNPTPAASIADEINTAGPSYTSGEQLMLNNLKDKLNEILQVLRDKGIISS